MSPDLRNSSEPISGGTPANDPAGSDAPGDILVVDDNHANLIAIEAALGTVGVRIVRAHSGNEALRLLLERDFALILMDVKMPAMGGLETARIIRARKRSKHTPIMFVTAHDRDDQDVLAAYKLGAVDFLFKPVVADVLRAKASVFVELQRRTAEVARQAALIQEHERREHERALGEERAFWEAEALRRQMEQLEEADRRKDHFLAVLGHELRNPLAPIVTGLEVLRCKLEQEPNIDETVLRTREGMERQALHLTRLVDDLLDISRINSGKIELQRADIAIAEVIEQAIVTSRPAIDQKQHTLQVELPPEPIVIFGDGVRLVQVISNLLNNSARYTDPGGEIRIACRRVDGQVEIRVVDNGRGISPEFRPRLFDMFAQEQPAAGSGLGLGLSVVKRLVSMHQGSVSAITPASGKGSEFVIELPIMMTVVPSNESAPSAAGTAAAGTAAAPSAIQALSPKPTPTMMTGDPNVADHASDNADANDNANDKADDNVKGATKQGLRVVLVEDNDDVREIMQDLLMMWGHTVDVATDGLAGAALIIKLKPDVALVDIGLPQLDGYGVATKVRADLPAGQVRLVAMTGFGQESDRRRARQAGFDTHLVKPPDIEALQKALSFQEE